jgi:hypothetical protein
MAVTANKPKMVSGVTEFPEATGRQPAFHHKVFCNYDLASFHKVALLYTTDKSNAISK